MNFSIEEKHTNIKKISPIYIFMRCQCSYNLVLYPKTVKCVRCFDKSVLKFAASILSSFIQPKNIHFIFHDRFRYIPIFYFHKISFNSSNAFQRKKKSIVYMLNIFSFTSHKETTKIQELSPPNPL